MKMRRIVKRIAGILMPALLLAAFCPGAYAAGSEDLDAVHSTAAYPQAGSYCKDSRYARVNAPKGNAVYCVPGSGGRGKDFLVAQGTVVQVLARQNGMSCVITPEGKSGWINSSYLLRIRPEAGWMLTEAVYRDGEGKEEQHITYRYNEDGLLEEVSRSEEEDGIPAVIRYDRDGMPLGLPYGYVYDSLGQSFHEEGFDDSVFSPESYDLSVKCDDKGRVISVTAMDKNRETGQDATYSYHYDSDGRFTKYHFKGDTVSDSTPRPETIVQFLYHSDGTRERRYDKNNEDVSYTARRLWDASGRLILIEHQNRGYTYPAQRLELDYDEEGSFIGSRLYENGKLVSQQEDMSWFEPWDYIVEDAHELSPADQELADAADFLERADETQRDENGNLISGYIYDKEGKLIKSGEFRYVYYEPQT